MFKKWKDEESSLSEILNTKLTKIRNQEWRNKLESWKARKSERASIKKRFLEQEVAMREFLQSQFELFTNAKKTVYDCQVKYDEFVNNTRFFRKDAKVINNFLAEIPDSQHHTMALDDLDRLFKNE